MSRRKQSNPKPLLKSKYTHIQFVIVFLLLLFVRRDWLAGRRIIISQNRSHQKFHFNTLISTIVFRESEKLKYFNFSICIFSFLFVIIVVVVVFFYYFLLFTYNEHVIGHKISSISLETLKNEFTRKRCQRVWSNNSNNNNNEKIYIWYWTHRRSW